MAEARSGPPPVPPRIDLGETEDSLPSINAQKGKTKNSNGLQTIDSTINSIVQDTSASSQAMDTVTTQQTAVAPNPIRNVPAAKHTVVAKSKPPTVLKANKPISREPKGRPEISIISACPMDQSNFATKSADQRGIPTPQAMINTNNNSSDVSAGTDGQNDTRHHPGPAVASKKPVPYNRISAGNTNKPANKVTRLSGKKTTNTSKSTSSIFYVDTNTEEEQFSKGGQVTYSKTDDQLNMKIEPAVRKIKEKPEPQKQSIEPPKQKPEPPKQKPEPKKQKPEPKKQKPESLKQKPESPKQKAAAVTELSSVDHTIQPDVPQLKTKPKPTIIASKKPRVTPVTKETKAPTSAKEAPTFEKNTRVDIPVVEEDPPNRPNVPPSDAKSLTVDETQPQRPKAPPNATHEEPKSSGLFKKKIGRQKDPKSAQKKPKSKPPRPPMLKEGGKSRPTKEAPAQPTARAHEKNKLASSKASGPPRATAKFDYSGETADDLTFKVGDTIMLTSKVDGDLFVGYLESNVMHQGLLPASFVDVIVPLKDTPQVKAEEAPPSEPYAVALHDFQGQSDAELSFSSNQTIILLERINEEWLRGRVQQNTGIFPQNFVRVERDIPEIVNASGTSLHTAPHSRDKGEWCRATHDYQADHEDDLSFVVGAEIMITEKLDDNWFKGFLGEKTGTFPASFVEIMPQPDNGSKDSRFVTAVHDYHGQAAEDLSFSAGDKIRIVERVNTEWLLGELNGKEGLFPASFVEDISGSNDAPVSPASSKPKSTHFAKAIHDFNGEHPGELHFKAGDTIEVLREIDGSWCEGMINNLSGIFPTAFVEMGTSNAQEPCRAKALYDYNSDTLEDLSFQPGDVIELLQQVNEDWWTGSLNGKTGQFPATFVEIIQ